MRQKIININGIRIIEDCYNANVESMKAALEVLGRGDKTGRRVAILGDMGELGNFAESAHKIIGDYVANNKTDLLITVGAHSKITAEQAKKRGTDTKILETNKEAVKFITNEIKKGDTILIKASRSAKFEEIANGIRQGIGNRE